MSEIAIKHIGRPRSRQIQPGELFGYLSAIKELPMSRGRENWLFRCNCGNFISRQTQTIYFGEKNNSTANCGCLTRKIRSASGKLKTIHGMCALDRLLYGVHSKMLQRCYSPKSKDYVNYGARGISVCQDWYDPVKFFAWAASSGYAHGLTIERNDVNGGYNPVNCTWVPNEVQSHNTRRNVFVIINGERKHLAGWARHFGLKWPTVASRIKQGWDVVRAVSAPIGSRA